MYGINEEKIKERYKKVLPEEMKVYADKEYTFHTKLKHNNTIKFEKSENGKMYFKQGNEWVPSEQITSKYKIVVMLGSLQTNGCSVELK